MVIWICVIDHSGEKSPTANTTTPRIIGPPLSLSTGKRPKTAFSLFPALGWVKTIVGNHPPPTRATPPGGRHEPVQPLGQPFPRPAGRRLGRRRGRGRGGRRPRRRAETPGP